MRRLTAAVKAAQKHRAIDESYPTGDAYNDEKSKRVRAEWSLTDAPPPPELKPEDMKYLLHVKALTNEFPHLRFLTDFMEIGTVTLRWDDRDLLKQDRLKQNPTERKRRAQKTKVCVLNYFSNGEVPKGELLDTPEMLMTALDRAEDDKKVQLQLYVVEDLSRVVIESLGRKYDVDPAFFRSQLVNYAWYNTRDPWRDPPALKKDYQRDQWSQIRFPTFRYFPTEDSFKHANEEANSWNVLRRPEPDTTPSKTHWDDEAATVSVTWSKASFWSRPAREDCPAIGIILLDPTYTKGFPLWGGLRNWQPIPPLGQKPSPGPPGKSLFDDFLYWAQKPEAFVRKPQTQENGAPKSNTGADLAKQKPPAYTHVPIQALLQLVGEEWLTVVDYTKSRLSQINWEVTDPKKYAAVKGDPLEESLRRLQIWRRYVSFFREMISETLERVFNFTCHGPVIINHAQESGDKSVPGPIAMYRHDFELALAFMIERDEQVDHLTTVTTNLIAIRDSERAMEDNRSLSKLTWLAAFFLPFSFVATLFAMQANVTDITRETVKWYFTVTIPFAAVIVVLMVLFKTISTAFDKWKEDNSSLWLGGKSRDVSKDGN